MKNESKHVTFHPSSFRLHPLVSSFILSVLDLFQQRIDALGLFFDRVTHKVKRGSMPQIERKAKLLAHVGRGVTQREHGYFVFMLIALHRDENTGVAQIVGDSHIGYGDHRQTRIFQFVTHDLRNLFAQSIGNALRAMHSCKDEGGRMKDETVLFAEAHPSISLFILPP